MLLAIPFATFGQGLKINDLRIGADGRMILQHTADTNSYYILRRGELVTAILTAKDIQMGTAGNAQLKDPDLAANTAFYLVQQVPLSNPLDTDADGIDDVFELKSRPLLDPLNPNDAALDPDGDGKTTLEEYRAGRNPFVAERPSVPTITYPTNATTASFVIFSGQGPTNTLIRVEGGAAYVTNVVDTTGAFELTVPLNPNRLNRLFVSAVDEFGQSSPLAPVDILQDSTPPYVFIDFPTNGMVLTTETTLVAGRVGDALSGFLGLNVMVNGQPAQVDVGIGPNGTYQRGGVSLSVGTNAIEVVATDRLGNFARKTINVVRMIPVGPRLVAVSGDLQETNILRRLAQPLVVKLTQGDGTPFANKLVNFQVTRSDGRLLPVNTNQLAADISTRADYSPNGTMFLQLFTDASGEARAWWTMGTDAGHANNRVSVSIKDVTETVNFCASASALPARQVNIGSGNNQRGETLAPAPEPLKVWVSDGNNPVARIPVTFRMVQGGGKLVPIVGADGTSPAGPGVRGSRPTGSIALQIPNPGSSRREEAQIKKSEIRNQKSEIQQSLVVSAATVPIAGSSEVTVLTAITGHAEVDFTFGPDSGNQIVEATFPGNAGLPATFVLSALARTPGQPTTFTGLIQDNTSQPIGGAYCELTIGNGTNVTVSDSQGRFAFLNLPSGAGHLYVNGATARSLGTNSISTNSFPSLQYSIAVVPNAENSLPTPVLLPRLNTNNAQWYYGTNDLVVTCEGIAGLKMTIKANSMHHSGGQLVDPSHPALVSLNQVHHDDIPMPMPDGASPPFAWTLQPGGSTFAPPAQVEYPNMSGLAAGAAAFFLTFNHDTERFEIVASGHMIADGSKIVTDAGAGLTISGWGCNCPPYSVTGNCKGDECDPSVPTEVAEFACIKKPGPPSDRPTNPGYTEPLEVNFDITPYCDPASRIWRAKVTQAEFVFKQYVGLGGYTEVQDALPNTSDCATLATMISDLRMVADQLPFDPSLFNQRPVYYNLAAVQVHEDTHVFLYKLDLNTLGLPPLKTLVAGLSVSLDSYSTSEEAKAAMKSLPEYQQAQDDLNLVVSKSIQRQKELEPLAINHAIVDPIIDTINAKMSGLGCPTPLRILRSGASTSSMAAQITPTDDKPIDPGNEGHPLRALGEPRAAALPSETWILSVNGQFISVSSVRSFTVRNIPAPDQFGPLGTGSRPDFIGDDFLRLTGMATSNGITRYVSSEFFQVRQGETYRIGNLTFSDTAPATPESLVLTVDQPTLTTLGQTTQVHTAGILANGAVSNLTSRTAFTTYRTSNPAIATVNPDGLVTAIARGTVFVTAGNDGASGVVQIDVVPGAALTTVIGVVHNADGTPAAGLVVTIPGQAPSGVTDAQGRFNISNVVAGSAPLSLLAQRTGADGHFVAIAEQIVPVSGGLTDGGVLILRPAPVVVATPFAAGTVHVVSIKQNGTLWAWGDNAYGQLGDGTAEDRTNPVQIGPDADWVAVAAGERHSLALKRNGSLWAWGENQNGQLGLPDFTIPSPARVGTDTDWVAVAAGSRHSLALKSNGTLWVSGRNNRGQLGTGGVTDSSEFVQLGAATTWSRIAAGFEHTLALQTDGSLWAWGANFSGQIGDGTTTALKTFPIRVGAATDWANLAAGRDHSLALKLNGTLWSWGSNSYGKAADPAGLLRSIPTQVGTASDWAAIAAGANHSIAVKENGSLMGWGLNYVGQLGQGTCSDASTNPVPISANSTWKAIAAGAEFTVALSADGSIWTWGANDEDQLARGYNAIRTTPLMVGNERDWALIAGGRWNSVALKRDGTLWTWGFNYLAELGDGTKVGKPFPSQIGSDNNWFRISTSESHTLALKTDSTLWGWGYSADGQVGVGSSSDYQLVPARIGVASNWTSCAAGHSHSAAVRANGTLWTWGLNNSGQLGNGTLSGSRSSPGQMGSETDWQAVAVGTSHTLAIKLNGTLWAWGNNARGQLGRGTSGPGQPTPAQVGTDLNWIDVSGGNLFTVALKADGSLWAWGENTSGQIGDGTGQNQSSPVRVGADNDWLRIDAGDDHVVAVRSDGSLWAWGRNSDGQVGDGTRENKLVPMRIGTGTDWLQVSGGEIHTLAVRSDGTVWAWGSNRYGQLADPSPFNPARVGTDTDWGLPAP